MYYYLYKITNLINGKIYIGVHRTNNLDDGYMGSGKNLQRAKVKYGIENFQKEILKYFDTEEEMGEGEAEVVNEVFVNREDTYNITCGGIGIDYECCKKGREVADQILYEKYGENGKEILSQKGRNGFTEETRNKISRNRKGKNKGNQIGSGRKHTEESKKKMSEAKSKEQQGSGNSQYGTMGIYNPELEQNKKIKKDDPIPEGGYKGRKMKFD